MTDDLATWLLACVDEDEQVIRRALARTRRTSRLDLPWWRAKQIEPKLRMAEQMLLAVWDPDRLLAECNTKRRIIDALRAGTG